MVKGILESPWVTCMKQYEARSQAEADELKFYKESLHVVVPQTSIQLEKSTNRSHYMVILGNILILCILGIFLAASLMLLTLA